MEERNARDINRKLTQKEINDLVLQIEALEPQTQESVLRYLDYLLQVQQSR